MGKLDPPPASRIDLGRPDQVVPKAFNKSSALAVLGADAIGLEKTLAYLNRTFPYFEAYGHGRPQIGDVVRPTSSDFSRASGAPPRPISCPP